MITIGRRYLIMLSAFLLLFIGVKTSFAAPKWTISTLHQELAKKKSKEDSTEIQLLLAKTHLKEGNLDSSIYYKRLIDKLNLTRSRNKALYYEVKGLIAYERELYSQAINYNNLAIREATISKTDESQWAILEYKNNIGRARIATNELEKAKEIYDEIFKQVKASHPSQIDSMLLSVFYNNMGVIHFYQGELDDAFQYYDLSRTMATMAGTGQDIQVGRALYNMGLVKEEKGFLIDATVLYEKALKIYLHNYNGYHHHIAEVYGSLGNIYLTRYELQRARYYFQKDLEVSTYLYGENHVESTWGYENMGRLYQEEGNDSLAYKMFDKALKIRNETYHGKHISIANLYLSLAEIEKNPQHSIRLAQQALKIENAITEKPTIGKWNISNLLIEQYLVTKNYKKAETEMIHALKRGQKLFPHQNHPLFVKTYLLGAKTYAARGLNSQTQYYIQKAISQCLHENKNRSNEKLLKVTDVENIPDYLQILIYKTQLDFENADAAQLQTDLKEIVEAVKMVEFHQKRRSSDDVKKHYSSIDQSLFEMGLKISFQLWKLTKDEKFFFQAFEFSERIKHTHTSELFHGIDAYASSNIPLTTIRREYQLKKDILYYETAFREANDSIKTVYNIKLKKLYDEEERFYTNLKKFHPTYYYAKYQFLPIKIKNIQERLQSDQVLWQSTFIDNKEYLLIIRNSKIEGYILKERSYSAIIENLLKSKINNWIVIPDYSSSWVNLEAHRFQGKYLIASNQFIYNTSATKFFQTAKSNALVNKKIVAFAPIFFKDKNLSTLKYSESEIQEMKGYFNVRSFTGKDATKENFLKNLMSYGGLHLSTHFSYDPIHPLKSTLHFASKDSSDNGKVYVHDIFGIPMRIQLVTLSVCDSKKDQQKFQEMGSIVDAFNYNGCRNILFSLWKVEDKVAQQILIDFYKYLSQGFSKEKAIQKAKINYIQHSDKYKSQPFYWSGFILQGNIEDLDLVPSIWSRYKWWLALALFLLSMIIIKKFE